ncbi:MAG: RHS repeat domain-containing protein [Ruminococcus sp.]
MFSKNNDKTISYVAFAFVYGYNENEMTVTNAELNILATGYVTKQSEDSKDDSSVSAGNESDDDTEVDNYVDYEVLSESVDKTKPFMQTSSEYDSTGNYGTSETNEQGSTTHYVYDVNGNVTSITDADDNVTSYAYDSSGNLTSVKNGDSENSYTYSGLGSVSKITHNGFSYSFNYDVFYNLVSTRIGNVAITSNTYDSNGNLAKTTYANGDYFEYSYDDYGNITLITGETGKIAEMIYNKQGLVTKAVDYSSGETSYYYYTFDGSLESEYRTSSDGSLTHYIVTDSDGNTVEKTSVNGQTKTITTGTDKDGKSFVSNDGVTNETSTDDFGRTTQVRTVRSDGKLVFNTDYEYANGKAENSTTNLVSKYSQSYGSDSVLSYDYSYDANGNITEIKQNGKLTNKYVYDSLNELKEEYDYVNKFYINYSYDGAGNLQNKYEQVLDPNYGYPTGTQHGNTYEYTDTSWKDKLTKVNGSNISYDANGNPLSYRDGMSFEWENGRILKNINTSDKAIQMSYDSNGMRTQKTVDGVKTNYYYDSNKNLIALVKGNDTLLFYYDSDGSATSFSYNGTMYFYVKNLQGDVIRIIDLAGTEVASYVYDAWGNIKDTKGEPTIREINPIRYRGYVYDTETSLYYLQSRYYDPFTGRFLNADDTHYIMFPSLMANLYTYCDNNAISNTDTNGKTAWLWMLGLYAVKKSMPLQFYFHSILNRQRYKCYDFSDNSMYADKILGSMAYYNFKKKYHIINLYPALERMYHQNRLYMIYNGTFDPYHTGERDLYLSIGQCKVNICYVIYGNVNKRHDIAYSVTVTFTDDYDFEHWTKSKKNLLTMCINNILGYYPQSLGLIVPYSWRIQYKFSGTFRCRH